MYRFITALWLLCVSTSLVFALNEDPAGFQMDTNMSETMLQKPNDSTLRFLQTLTNQQEEIQNLNLAIQQQKRKSKIERENLSHRVSFMSFLLWGILFINGVLLFIFIIMGFRLRSFSKKIEATQSEMDAIQTEIKTPSFAENETMAPNIKLKSQKRPEQDLDLSPTEEHELEGLLASDHDSTVFSDNEGQNFFKQFQSEIDRERLQLKNSDKSEAEKSENDLLDELIEQHFSDGLKGKG